MLTMNELYLLVNEKENKDLAAVNQNRAALNFLDKKLFKF